MPIRLQEHMHKSILRRWFWPECSDGNRSMAGTGRTRGIRLDPRPKSVMTCAGESDGTIGQQLHTSKMQPLSGRASGSCDRGMQNRCLPELHHRTCNSTHPACQMFHRARSCKRRPQRQQCSRPVSAVSHNPVGTAGGGGSSAEEPGFDDLVVNDDFWHELGLSDKEIKKMRAFRVRL